jgi:hypothetical protein
MDGAQVFHCFHFNPASQRVSQVRNMGVIDGQQLLSSNDWGAVNQGDDKAIREWINRQMAGRSCVVVLKSSLASWVEEAIEIRKRS